MKKISAILLICGLSLFASEAKKEVSADYAKSSEQFKKCAACHGAFGEKNALGKSAKIGELKQENINTALVNYKKGLMNKYGMGPVMKSQVATMSDEDLLKLSKYVSELKSKNISK